MASRYASKTEVSSERSRTEIERTLTRYGATSFSYGWQPGYAAIQFIRDERRIRLVLPLPGRDERQFTHHSRGPRTAAAAESAYEQAVRQKWRALALIVKAKMEAVESGLVQFEDEFLAYTVLPSGRTVAEEVGPAIEHAYRTGQVEPLQIAGPPAH